MGVRRAVRNALPLSRFDLEILKSFLIEKTAWHYCSRAASSFELKPVKVDLPDRERMFPGPGSDAINNNCLGCHSTGMVLNQPELSKQVWAAEVNKMINAYKAPIAPEDVGPIVEYLARLKGAK
jgi:hypothetical protein